METVKAIPKQQLLEATIGSRPSWSALLRKSETDQTTSVLGHKVNDLRIDIFGRHHQIGFILTRSKSTLTLFALLGNSELRFLKEPFGTEKLWVSIERFPLETLCPS